MPFRTYKNLQEFIDNYKQGLYKNITSTSDAAGAGWVDWFNNTEGLSEEMNILFPAIEAAAKCPVIDPQKTTLLFKEVNRSAGDYITGFRLETVDNGKGLFWSEIDENGLAEVWDFRENSDCENVLHKDDSCSVTSIVNYFTNLK